MLKKCTAPIKTNRQNHSFHVEFIVFANASIRFCQVLLVLWMRSMSLWKFLYSLKK